MSVYRFYNWVGPYQRGAMRTRRELKRVEAEQRNAAAQPIERHVCGHKHSSVQANFCRLAGA